MTNPLWCPGTGEQLVDTHFSCWSSARLTVAMHRENKKKNCGHTQGQVIFFFFKGRTPGGTTDDKTELRFVCATVVWRQITQGGGEFLPNALFNPGQPFAHFLPLSLEQQQVARARTRVECLGVVRSALSEVVFCFVRICFRGCSCRTGVFSCTSAGE